MHDFSELAHGAMLHKVVWQSHSCYGWLVAMVTLPFQNGISHASVSYSILYGDDVLELLAHLFEEAIVEWLQESHVVVGDAQRLAFRFQFDDSLGCIVSDRTDGEHGDVVAIL